MKHFEPIIIQEETFFHDEVKVEKSIPNKHDFIDLVFQYGVNLRFGLTHAAATRLRDALNTILNANL